MTGCILLSTAASASRPHPPLPPDSVGSVQHTLRARSTHPPSCLNAYSARETLKSFKNKSKQTRDIGGIYLEGNPWTSICNGNFPRTRLSKLSPARRPRTLPAMQPSLSRSHHHYHQYDHYHRRRRRRQRCRLDLRQGRPLGPKTAGCTARESGRRPLGLRRTCRAGWNEAKKMRKKDETQTHLLAVHNRGAGDKGGRAV